MFNGNYCFEEESKDKKRMIWAEILDVSRAVVNETRLNSYKRIDKYSSIEDSFRVDIGV